SDDLHQASGVSGLLLWKGIHIDLNRWLWAPYHVRLPPSGYIGDEGQCASVDPCIDGGHGDRLWRLQNRRKQLTTLALRMLGSIFIHDCYGSVAQFGRSVAGWPINTVRERVDNEQEHDSIVSQPPQFLDPEMEDVLE